MNPEPIHERLVAEGEELAHRARTWMAAHLHHKEGTTTMSVLDSIETELTAAENKAAEVYNHAKTVLEQHLPAIKADVAKVENEPFVKAYLGAQLAVPEHLVNAALSILTALVQASPAPAAAEAPAATESAA